MLTKIKKKIQSYKRWAVIDITNHHSGDYKVIATFFTKYSANSAYLKMCAENPHIWYTLTDIK